jgi:hypothetical protein
MTLQDKFKKWLDTKPRVQIRDVQLQVIADDYAIEFLRWCFDYENEKDYYLKALNEFKKQKGL